jgi:hypothetical protein
MKKLYDVFRGSEWIGCTLAHSAQDALYYTVSVGGSAPTDGYTAAPAINTRICSDGRSV